MNSPFIAHKFGGTSLASADRISKVVDILLARSERQVVVVSAMSGVTDALIRLVHQAAQRDETWRSDHRALFEKHRQTAQALLGDRSTAVLSRLDVEFQALNDLLHAQALLGTVSEDLLDVVSGLGEVFSSCIVNAVFQARSTSSQWVDAREIVVVEKGELGAMVDWPESTRRFQENVASDAARLVVTGFVARTKAGRTTTLGRNGSDYSGAIFAALSGAAELHIWTDVDGVLSADPRLVPDAVLIHQLSYSEACELAYFGAKVIHPQTMAPAFDRQIPIITRNTFNPTHPGTRISLESDAAHPVKGVTTFSGLAVLNIEGAGMIGVPGTAERAFDALKQAHVSVVMISQGSSEHSICCVVNGSDAQRAKAAVENAFAREVAAKLIQNVALTPNVTALAVVGDGMAGMPGVAARLFTSLARADVNVRVIAQGASERNISVIVDSAAAHRALRAVHAGFYLSPQTISIGVIGPGQVGSALLRQISAARLRLLEKVNVDLRVRAIAGRSKMLLSESPMTVDGFRETIDRQGVATEIDAFERHVKADHIPHAVIIDCSASSALADSYASWLRAGIHVITPNKHGGSGSFERFTAIKSVKNASFRYESTVGAGLPVISTLRDLLDTGDEVLAIDGIFSGTLAYLFNRFDGSTPFSALVKEAKSLGYTEPDPRDDLSGMDVARKLVILARECGWAAQVDQVQLESLVVPALRSVSVDELMARLGELDGPLDAKLKSARKENRVLRYVAHLDSTGKASVGLVALESAHPFAHSRLTDNVIAFTTKRYRDNPLVISGPGAGPEVTAAGIFADLLRVAASLGAKL